LRRWTDRILRAVPIMGLNEVDALARVQSLEMVRIDVELAQLS
jgi:flagellar biosynthesis protein FlhA